MATTVATKDDVTKTPVNIYILYHSHTSYNPSVVFFITIIVIIIKA